MDRKDVKVGMKVKVRGSLFARMGENMAINVFIVGECHNEYFFSLKAYGNDNNFMAHCADFEPYEEPIWTTYKQLQQHFNNQFKAMFTPQENPLAPPSVKFPKEETTTYQVKDLEGNVIEENVVEDKQELIKPTIQKLDDGGYVIDLDKLDKGTYTPKELLDIIYEVIKASENLPITQEFIESFGFGAHSSSNKVKHFIKRKGEYVTFLSWYLEFNVFKGFFKKEDMNRGEVIMEIPHYTCATQSELRFLLTKGRIDCSK